MPSAAADAAALAEEAELELELEPPQALHDNVMRQIRKEKKPARRVWLPAAAIAAAAALVLLAGQAGILSLPGFDREDMKLPDGHLRMIEAVACTNPNTVVVLLCGGVVECPWEERVKAILYMGLPGQAGGEAVADLLYGCANPSGKLDESWPYRYEDVPSSELYGKTADALYQEGLYVGYRYYDKAGVPVRWPFGYGLSYTKFTYSNLTLSGDTVFVPSKIPEALPVRRSCSFMSKRRKTACTVPCGN